MVDKVHVFERAGLGVAPFRVVGVEVRRGPLRTTLASGVVVEVGSPGQPMGCCKFCGQGIAECWMIESSDGRRFEVGCDCVRKTGDAGLRKVVTEHEAAKRASLDAHKTEEARELLARDDVRAALATEPHPLVWRAKQGDTLLDWCEWMLEHAGASGRAKVYTCLKWRVK